jgi:hypothetical protein
MGTSRSRSLLLASLQTLRPFGRLWLFLLAVALSLTFGFGGGTPSTAGWLIGKFVLLGVLLTSLLAELVSQLRDRRRHDR